MAANSAASAQAATTAQATQKADKAQQWGHDSGHGDYGWGHYHMIPHGDHTHAVWHQPSVYGGWGHNNPLNRKLMALQRVKPTPANAHQGTKPARSSNKAAAAAAKGDTAPKPTH
jgi:hypothetical protein